MKEILVEKINVLYVCLKKRNAVILYNQARAAGNDKECTKSGV